MTDPTIMVDDRQVRYNKTDDSFTIYCGHRPAITLPHLAFLVLIRDARYALTTRHLVLHGGESA